MKVEELMVKDWVRNDLGETQQVVELREEGVMLYYNDIYPYDDIQPIPLTPEILEKNGFHETESNKYFPTPRWVFIQDGSRDGVIIEITFYQKSVNGVNVLTKVNTQSSKDGGVNKLHSCDIETIHELQHALRLCGIEKEITL